MRTKAKLPKYAALLMLALGGGTVLSSCQTLLRDAVVIGTKTYVLQGLLPSLMPVTEDEDDTDAEE